MHVAARRAALAIGMAAMLPVAPAPAAGNSCSAAGARTVLQNARARVFVVVRRQRDRSPLFYGCVRGGRPRLLAADVHSGSETIPDESNSMFALGGTTVAWLYEHRDTEDYSREIRATSLTHSRPSLDVSTWDGGLAEDENYGRVGGL